MRRLRAYRERRREIMELAAALNRQHRKVLFLSHKRALERALWFGTRPRPTNFGSGRLMEYDA